MKLLRNLIVIAVGILSTLYILNPTAGVFEIIPDNMPLIGNLDEAAAVALIISCFAHFGFDLRLFGRKRDKDNAVAAKDIHPNDAKKEDL